MRRLFFSSLLTCSRLLFPAADFLKSRHFLLRLFFMPLPQVDPAQQIVRFWVLGINLCRMLEHLHRFRFLPKLVQHSCQNIIGFGGFGFQLDGSAGRRQTL